MKKIAFWNNYTYYANNRVFDPSAYGIGEDIGYPVILLKEKLEKKGYVVETLDMDAPENFEKIIFFDYPNPRTCCHDVTKIPKEKKFLILSECEMIYHPNKNSNYLQNFEKVFAYNDNLVKNAGYIKLNIPNKIKYPDVISFKNKKFSVIISGNKMVYDKGELYSERLKAIRYMEKNHKDEFDLYGFGWDRKYFAGIKLIRFLNRFSWLTKTFADKHICYCGKVDKKLDTLKNYKFCFCYENSCIIPGYISEKIMDCFFSGVVPIYYGAPNVTDYIPPECFIDFRDFYNYDKLYCYLRNMTEDEYNKYIEAISKFLKSSEIRAFSADSYVDTLLEELKV